MNTKRLHFSIWIAAMTGFLLSLFAMGGHAENAPGAPGAPSVWAAADKSFLGTSASNASRVYFTGAHGIVTEVFYPTVDQAQTVDLQFLVGDAGRTWVDEEKLQSSSAIRPDPRSLLWQVATTNSARDWKITKRIFTDPVRNALIQRVTFEALNGKNVSQFNLYVLHNPSMSDSGPNDNSRTVTEQSKTLLVASEGQRASALGISLPWKNGMASNGFVGKSDGWTDLLGGAADKNMNWSYGSANTGNVAQMGWIDFGTGTDAKIAFDVVLGFGNSESEAIKTAVDAFNAKPADTETAYTKEWAAYADSLDKQNGLADDQYYLAAMVLKSSQDKSNGAMVAGMGTPWGETEGDGTNNNHGYHLVWSRDLFKFANALINAGDKDSANRAVDYLFKVQMDKSNGRFPQNSWVDGRPYWNGTQMDEQAMPIILAWRLGRTDLWPQIQKTADYIVNNGPRTDQERWEENAGYSPSTIAAEIAGLVCAADIAKANHDNDRANRYLVKADEWRNLVDNWTFTTSGPHGNGRYYIRITGDTDPNSGIINIGNGGGSHEEKSIVDGGFLELVRMGVKSPNDPNILESIPEYDAVLKQTIAGKGDAWFRYNCDGYGERNDGSNYRDYGKGRLWPIFTAERGMYEIGKAGKGNAGTPYLKMLKAFSGETGMISEQIWNISANVGGCDVQTPSTYTPGTATKSIRPLNWAMGEYINLLASINLGKIVDVPEVVCKRYGCDLPNPFKRTVILIKGETKPGQDMFIRGGIDHNYAASKLGKNCTRSNFECAIPIKHNNLRNSTTEPWKRGDQYLDWYGQESGQTGQSHGILAQGTSLDWTTDRWPPEWGPKKTVAVDGYGEEPLNTFGQHYWMFDVDLDCSRTVGGWFEFKSFITNGPGWEGDINQPGTPYQSRNHFALCGSLNVFTMGVNDPVAIKPLP